MNAFTITSGSDSSRAGMFVHGSPGVEEGAASGQDFSHTLARQTEAASAADRSGPGQTASQAAATAPEETGNEAPAGSLADVVRELTARSREVAARTLDLRAAANQTADVRKSRADADARLTDRPRTLRMPGAFIERPETDTDAPRDLKPSLGLRRDAATQDAADAAVAVAGLHMAMPPTAAGASGLSGESGAIRSGAGRDTLARQIRDTTLGGGTGGDKADLRVGPAILGARAHDGADAASVATNSRADLIAHLASAGTHHAAPELVGAQAALAQANPQPAAAAMPAAFVAAPLGSAQWAPAFSQQMVQLSASQDGAVRHVDLRLDPPELGPIRVTLSLHGDQASALFLSPHPAVRAAVEAALPTLQQAMADAGINLGQTSVGDQRTPDHPREAARQTGSGGSGDGPDEAPERIAAPSQPRGLVDTFA